MEKRSWLTLEPTRFDLGIGDFKFTQAGQAVRNILIFVATARDGFERL